jgi:hypothetical protein
LTVVDERLISPRLHEACEREFEAYVTHYVDGLFEACAALPGAGDIRTAELLPIPVIGEPGFFAGLDFPHHREDARNAMLARERFSRTSPIWAPRLPLRKDECEFLRKEDNPSSVSWGITAHHCAGLAGVVNIRASVTTSAA